MSDLKNRLTEDMKSAMRAKDKERLQTVRSILAAIKQQEVDTRKELSDDDVIAVLDKMRKQRKESISQFTEAGRDDLREIEEQELAIIETYLPEPLSDDEISAMIATAIEKTGASSMKEMGKVMGLLKGELAGRADMGKVSGMIKSLLN